MDYMTEDTQSMEAITLRYTNLSMNKDANAIAGFVAIHNAIVAGETLPIASIRRYELHRDAHPHIYRNRGHIGTPTPVDVPPIASSDPIQNSAVTRARGSLTPFPP